MVGKRTHVLPNCCESYTKAEAMTKAENPPRSVLAWKQVVFGEDAVRLARCFYDELLKNGDAKDLAERVFVRMQMKECPRILTEQVDKSGAPTEPRRTTGFNEAAWAWPCKFV